MGLLLLLLFVCAFGDTFGPVLSLPGLNLTSKTLAGKVVSNATFDSELFMLFFESNLDPANDPLVLFLQGGPGCASTFGAFVENGPNIIQNDGSFLSNPFAWNLGANLLYIDSPPGTGFSTTNSSEGIDTTERAIALDLYNALQAFFRYNNSQYRNGADFYIAGESYAGKYVPFLAAFILNQTVAPGDYQIPLKGVLIGNGWVDPQVQMKSYVPFLQLHGMCSPEDAAWAESQYAEFDALLAAGNTTAAAAIDNSILARLTTNANISDPYNILDNPDPTASRVAALSAYLNSSVVQTALNVVPYNPNFQFCSSAPYNALSADEERYAGYQLRWVINNGVDATLYNGELDLICDWIGTRNFTMILGFNGQEEFNSAPNIPWYSISGKYGGLAQTNGQVSLVTIANAGHMVPFDRSEAALTMLLQYTSIALKK